MPILIRYQRSDGMILGGWQSPLQEMVEANRVADDPTCDYLLEQEDRDPRTLGDYWVQDGVLTPKTQLTLTAAPAPFPADGMTVCQVSVTPFTPCTVLVDGTPYALVAEDPVLELTADAPHRFAIALGQHAALHAEMLYIEAR